MLIRDTFHDFLQFWNVAPGASFAQRAAAWDAYVQRHADLFAASGGRLGGAPQLDAALPRYAAGLPRMFAMRAELEPLIAASMSDLAALFTLAEFPVRWALAVGTYWSDGWVCDLGGQSAMVLALEMVESPCHARLLVGHEMAHLAHAQAAGVAWDGLVTLGDALLLEGLAVYVSSRLVPGQPDEVYLWLGLSRTPSGEAPGEWLARCHAAWPGIRHRLQRDLLRTGQPTLAAWFQGDACAADTPVRAGYAAGFRVVSRLAAEFTVAEMARWHSARVTREVARVLEAI